MNDYSKHFHSTRGPTKAGNFIGVDYPCDRPARRNFPLEHPNLPSRTFDWGPHAYLSDLDFLAGALLLNTFEKGALDYPIACFGETCSLFVDEVLIFLPDRWSLWDYEIYQWAVARRGELQE